MTTPGNTPQSPCGWEPDAPCLTGPGGPCCPDTTTDPAIGIRAKRIAASLIWRLTGLQYGCCEVTVRPCKPKTCDPLQLSRLIYWDSRLNRLGQAGNLGVLSYFPTLIGGEVYNISCGCPTGCCKCVADCEVKLPGPICAVSNVTVDGVTLDPAWYRVVDGNTLVFNHILKADPGYAAGIATENALGVLEATMPDSTGTAAPFVPNLAQEAKFASYCPPCQDYNLPAGEIGTWTVTYTIGTPVPEDVNFAAGLYACEIAKALTNDASCGLSPRVKNVVRQGQNVAFFDPTVLANFGLTGIPIVDDIIRAVNPYRMAQTSRVWFPGKTSTVRRDT